MTFETSKIEIIVKNILKTVPSVDKRNVERFIHAFFENNRYDEIKTLSLETLETLLLDLWNLFTHRTLHEAKCEIYEIKLNPQSNTSSIIINLINDNMPFILDSFIGFMGRLGLRPHILIRPNLRVQRDATGQLQEIHPTTSSQIAQESIIHCEIHDPISPEIISVLKSELPSIQRDVGLANRDWSLMRLKIKEAAANINSVRETISSEQIAETKEFLSWLDKDHFTFLGYREYNFSAKQQLFEAETLKSEALGILSASANHDIGLFYYGAPFNAEIMKYILKPEAILITKTTSLSNVHRAVPMDSVSVKKFNDKGEVVRIRQFIGLFTSIAYNSSGRDIPLLRQKISHVIKASGYSPTGHDGKALAHIMDSLPRDELLQASEKVLLKIGTKILSIQERHQLALFIRRDYFDRFLSCLVYIPRNRFNYELIERIGNTLKQELFRPVTVVNAQYGDLGFARIHYMAHNSQNPPFKDYKVEIIENKLSKIISSWTDNLHTLLNIEFGIWKGTKLFQKYSQAFSKVYQENFDEQTAVIDIKYIEKAHQTQEIQVRIYRPEGALQHVLKLKLYHPRIAIPLSDILPMLENMDLKVEGEFSSIVIPPSQKFPVWIHDFETISRDKFVINIPQIEEKFLNLFSRAWHKDIENDGFNRLVLHAGLDWKQCTMLRAYAKYLRQLQIPFSQTYMEEILAKNREITYLITQIFIKRFHPLSSAENQPSLKVKIQEIFLLLEKVDNPDEDRILRCFINLITSTTRTNYFHLQKGRADKSLPKESHDHTSHPSESDDFKNETCKKTKMYLSFKFNCKTIEELPSPHPLYEIFVYSPRFEAVHLRGSKVSRGGIRWSDRKEDFRTEVLGLLKAQMVKNAIIIPKGSKGGFIVKTSTEAFTKEQIFAEGIECYKLMMQALLELTDNIKKGEIISPRHTVIYDHDDPYLVVAADKGTATFSDYANTISKKTEFWLEDAFASGGSTGYDHKAIGITARGAWESVKRHFWELGIDLAVHEIRVIGIGDMSGDVFGNGLLQSSLLKLVAAFNHRHIFIDPSPDTTQSFLERKRLFEKQLSWDAYNPDLISKGGGVFARNAKIIHISPEIKSMLSLTKVDISPNELIQAILMARVDLMWFGGIGTYIKSRFENHLEVGDRSNDNIRINANVLKCKVIAEGANLGVTQRARIEFARLGGRINTDAIDNSGGVDCSDHEVNIKILLRQAIVKGKLTLEDRNTLLEQMTNEVANLVLKNNYDQNLCLSLMNVQSSRILDQHIKLLHFLEKTSGLDRALEYLPDDTELAEYHSTGIGLVRPQLAILLPYAKNALTNSILNSYLPDEDFLQQEAKLYFPKPLQDKYTDFIKLHPLKREIIATVVANKVINRMGPSFVHELVEKTHQSIDDVIRAYYMVLDIFKIEDFWQAIENLKTRISATSQLQIFQKLGQLVYRISTWFLKQFPAPLDVLMISNMFIKGIENLSQNLKVSLHKNDFKLVEKEVLYYQKLGLSNDSSKHIVELEIIASSLDIILIAEKTKASVAQVASLYFTVGVYFKFDFLQKLTETLKSNNSWERMATNALVEDLQTSQSALTTKILHYNLSYFPAKLLQGNEMVQAWVNANPNITNYIEHLFIESRAMATPDLALLTVLQRELRVLSS